MSRGQLREDVAQRFGDFLKAQGFRETHYEYSQKFFGNEILDLKSGEVVIRFVRNRLQISIDLKKGSAPHEPIHVLLAKLGVPEPKLPPGWIPQPGWLFGADHLIPEWSQLLGLLG